jgi:hypothetical protein
MFVGSTLSNQHFPRLHTGTSPLICQATPPLAVRLLLSKFLDGFQQR